MSDWEHRTATIADADATHLTVRCPYVPGHEHTHGRRCAGSNSVVAGCHAGYSRCRTYEIPSLPNSQQRNGKKNR